MEHLAPPKPSTRGLADADAGRFADNDALKSRYGIGDRTPRSPIGHRDCQAGAPLAPVWHPDDVLDAAKGRDLASFYRRYNARCNAHEFHTLNEFVSECVEVNGEVQGLHAYVEGLEGVVHAFPDFRWELRHLIVDDCWISAHFLDTGTHRGTFLGVPATGRRVSTQEFAVYRVDAGKIAEVWVAADNLGILNQLR